MEGHGRTIRCRHLVRDRASLAAYSADRNPDATNNKAGRILADDGGVFRQQPSRVYRFAEQPSNIDALRLLRMGLPGLSLRRSRSNLRLSFGRRDSTSI